MELHFQYQLIKLQKKPRNELAYQRGRDLSFYLACTHISASFPLSQCNIPTLLLDLHVEALPSMKPRFGTPHALELKLSKVSLLLFLGPLVVYPIKIQKGFSLIIHLHCFILKQIQKFPIIKESFYNCLHFFHLL